MVASVMIPEALASAPPGFYGVECQHQCPEGFIGKNCNFPLSHVKPNTKNAKGILLCAEEPFGCTCGAGYFGARCEKECSNGKWGPNCNLNCDCKDGKCNKYNGTCLTSTQNSSGSTDDYSTTTEEPQSNNGIIIGVIFALLFLIVAALICVYFRENIRKYIYLGKQSLLLGDIKTIPQEPEDCPWLEDSGVPECTGENLELCITSEQIEVSLSMAEYSFETEEWFKSVPRKFNKSITTALLPENIMKNRYKGIVPYDDKRVVLSKLPGDDFSDYINASYITTKYSKKFYIATQGPKDFNVNTIADFWRMVWEVNCPAIVMVARLMENGKFPNINMLFVSVVTS
ncbi:uncharacterized protein LOC143030412 [Oratosquilla oratoria]|uniref:uncharacterized protein LOC143030412 n=1 Tax=Oratosquilla oratoria TaxID=337810 RepID=UPI003F757765